MLGEIIFRFNSKVSNNTFYSHDFIIYSAHYATILGLMAALNFDPASYPADEIPNFGALLFLELHLINSTEYVVRLNFMDGVNDTFHPITWPAINGSCDNLIDCPYEEFLSMVTYGSSLNSFCTLCQNCAQFYEMVLPNSPLPWSQTAAANGLVGAVITILAGAIAIGLFNSLKDCHKKNAQNT